MNKQQEGQWVVPNPQLPRSFGLMNIIFGSILLLFGVGQAALTFYSPVVFKGFEDQARRQLEELKAKRQTKIAELKDKVKTAKTEEEKKDLEMELQALQSNQGLDPAKFLDEIKSLQTDPRIAIYTYTEMSTGILLNLLMIVSGVGLLALAEWARRLAIATAWLKIARWVAIVAATTFVIVPITTEKMQPTFRSIEKQTGRFGGRAAPFAASNLAELSAMANVVTAVGTALVAVVYPVFVIWFLTRPPARAACLAAAKPSRAGGLDRELAGP